MVVGGSEKVRAAQTIVESGERGMVLYGGGVLGLVVVQIQRAHILK